MEVEAEMEQRVPIKRVALNQHLRAKRRSDKASFITEACEKRCRTRERNSLQFSFSEAQIINKKNKKQTHLTDFAVMSAT